MHLGRLGSLNSLEQLKNNVWLRKRRKGRSLQARIHWRIFNLVDPDSLRQVCIVFMID